MDTKEESFSDLPPLIQDMIDASMDVRERAHCPYSDFRVGSAVLTADDSIIAGCNVENASYGLSVCAERLAVFKAVSEGHRKFKAIAIACDVVGTFQASCGACRQVLAEFGMDWEMYLVKPDKTFCKVSFRDLLPMAFVPDSLQQPRI